MLDEQEEKWLEVDGEHFAFPELEVLDLSYNHIVQITNAPVRSRLNIVVATRRTLFPNVNNTET